MSTTESNAFLKVDPERIKVRVTSKTAQAVFELAQEQFNAATLREADLEPRHRVLLAGPSGNGKALLAERIARMLEVPLIIACTSNVTRQEIISKIGSPCVLLFPNIDSPEVIRVLDSLFVRTKDLPSHAVIVCATERPKSVSRSLWQRFQMHLFMSEPTHAQTVEHLSAMFAKVGYEGGRTPESLAHEMPGISYAAMDLFCTNVRRRIALAGEDKDIDSIIGEQLNELYAASEWGRS